MATKHSKTNPELIDLIGHLKTASREHDARIWRAVAERLAKPRRNHATVNVTEICRIVTDGETVLVPGKILGTGLLDKRVIVSALSISATAKAKVEEAGGQWVPIRDLIVGNPTGTGIRIMR